MDTPTTLPLDISKEEFIGAVFDGEGNQLVVCSYKTEAETSGATIRSYVAIEETWAESGALGDPPMWDLYKRGPDAYHRHSRAVPN